jgi:hypothetical protein
MEFKALLVLGDPLADLARVAAGSFYRVSLALALPLLPSCRQGGNIMIKAFVVGAVAGGVAYWLWGNEINRMVEVGTRDLRAKAANKLKEAESLVESASETIGQTIHAGQEAVRPRNTTLRSAT